MIGVSQTEPILKWISVELEVYKINAQDSTIYESGGASWQYENCGGGGRKCV